LRCYREHRGIDGLFSLHGNWYELAMTYLFTQNDLKALAKKGVLEKNVQASSRKHKCYQEGPRFGEVVA
jgi:hypothetical protein